MRRPRLLELPDDVLGEVAAQLDAPSDRAALRSTCKRLRAAVDAAPPALLDLTARRSPLAALMRVPRSLLGSVHTLVLYDARAALLHAMRRAAAAGDDECARRLLRAEERAREPRGRGLARAQPEAGVERDFEWDLRLTNTVLALVIDDDALGDSPDDLIAALMRASRAVNTDAAGGLTVADAAKAHEALGVLGRCCVAGSTAARLPLPPSEAEATALLDTLAVRAGDMPCLRRVVLHTGAAPEALRSFVTSCAPTVWLDVSTTFAVPSVDEFPLGRVLVGSVPSAVDACFVDPPDAASQPLFAMLTRQCAGLMLPPPVSSLSDVWNLPSSAHWLPPHALSARAFATQLALGLVRLPRRADGVRPSVECDAGLAMAGLAACLFAVPFDAVDPRHGLALGLLVAAVVGAGKRSFEEAIGALDQVDDTEYKQAVLCMQALRDLLTSLLG